MGYRESNNINGGFKFKKIFAVRNYFSRNSNKYKVEFLLIKKINKL